MDLSKVLKDLHARFMKQPTLKCKSKETRNTLLISRHIIVDNQRQRQPEKQPDFKIAHCTPRSHSLSGARLESMPLLVKPLLPCSCMSASLADLFWFFHSLYSDQQNTYVPHVVIVQATTFLHNSFSKLHQLIEHYLYPPPYNDLFTQNKLNYME